MDSLFEIPTDFEALSDEDLQSFVDNTRAQIVEIAGAPQQYVSTDRSSAQLQEELSAAIAAVETAEVELDARVADEALDEVVDEAEPVSEGLTDEDVAAFQALAERASEPEEVEVEEVVEAEPVVASAAEPEAEPTPEPEPTQRVAAPRRLPRAAQSRRPVEAQEPRVALTAAAALDGYQAGEAFPSMDEVARTMQARRRNFGIIPDGTRGEKVPIVRADWSDLYPPERHLTADGLLNEAIVAEAINEVSIRKELERRRENALVASGGLCAPVTPYYQLAMMSIADRPVRAALPAFNADRGGIRYARPATLASITTAVGIRTAEEDAAGGTEAEKTCQIVDCPDFQETDVEIIFHCLQFGNLGARTFPERVTQWNNLTLAAHARLAESNLLTNIDAFSTQVTAGDLGLGASATLFSQILTAGDAMRSRHRMDPKTTLRILLPWWAVHVIVSDVFRGQFQRWDVDQAKVVALLRSIDVEPSFYIDGANGRGQVYGTQSDGSLLPFPSDIVWYLYPEGSFLYVDGGTLELGLVRDSVLNKTNDFQIFGESFENVAYVGLESYAVVSTTCDSGTTSAPHATACPVNYGD